MKRITSSLQPQYLLLTLLTVGYSFAQEIGFNTTTPTYQFQMVNVGNIGATTLGEFTNSGIDGVALSSYNTDATNGYNAFEGAIDYSNTTTLTSGVFGLSLAGSGNGVGVRGAANSSDGYGVYGTIPTTGTWFGFGGFFAGGLAYVNGLYNLSDAYAKKDIQSIDNALDGLLELSGYQYTYNMKRLNPDVQNNSQIHYGFIAENVKKQFPYAVARKNVFLSDDEQLRFNGSAEKAQSNLIDVVDYTAIIPITVEAIKEQQKLIEAQENKIAKLEAQIAELKAMISNLSNKD